MVVGLTEDECCCHDIPARFASDFLAHIVYAVHASVVKLEHANDVIGPFEQLISTRINVFVRVLTKL